MGTLYINGVPLESATYAGNLEMCDGCNVKKPVSKGAYSYLPAESGDAPGDPFIWLCYECHDGLPPRN